MSGKDIKTICLKLESLHEKILKSKFAEQVYESEMMSLILAIGELEKQIPKKPTPHKVEVDKIKIGNANWGKGTTIYKCPCCNEFISRIYDYCYKCGQALDWSDTI